SAHDSRDFAFAKHFNLPILPVVKIPAEHDLNSASYDAKEGQLTNSDFLNGLDVKDAIKKAIEYIEKGGHGKGKTNFRLRDAIFGRQRYWGEPIPVYYKNGMPQCIPADKLPLVLPEVDKFLPTEDGEPPLARAEKWMWNETKGCVDSEGYPIETTTMPGWAGSSWYFLRYMDPKNNTDFVGQDAVNYWRNVDLYMGGSEHATGHLLYVRFWTKFLFDRGFIPVNEPAQKLINQGMIQGRSEKVVSLINDISFAIEGPTYDNEGCIDESRYFVLHTFESSVFNDDFKVKEIRVKIDNEFPSSMNHILISSELIKNIDGHGIKLNIDINDVKNGEIMFDKFFQNELQKNVNNIFVTSGGIWVKGRFYSNVNNNSGSDSFKTFSEVEKMSKSKWNVVTPDDIVADYGADTLRLYEMFLGPLEQSKPWSTQGIEGVHRFLKKLWRLFYDAEGNVIVTKETADKKELKSVHKLIKKVGEDIEHFSFNTSVPAFMICVNELMDLKCHKHEILENIVVCLHPYAPHITEELWAALGNSRYLMRSIWLKIVLVIRCL
ncbi:MAG: class I tRNA ligase family protein, partial [Bacteroidia bacterium]